MSQKNTSSVAVDRVENRLRGIVYMLICVGVTALAGAATKHISGDVPVSTIICVQYAICLLILLPRVLSAPEQLKTQQLPTHIIRGLGGWLCFLCYYIAIDHIPLVEAALLRSASPLCVPLVIFLLTFRPIQPLHWLPIIIGFIGVGLILRPESGGISVWHVVGFLSAVFLAVSMVFTRKLTFTESGQTILFYYFLISFLAGLPLLVMGWQPVDLNVIPYLLFIGVAIYIALWLYTKAYAYAKASVVSPFSYFGVVFAGLLGWGIWGHTPDLLSVIGICLVVCGGVVMLVLKD